VYVTFVNVISGFGLFLVLIERRRRDETSCLRNVFFEFRKRNNSFNPFVRLENWKEFEAKKNKKQFFHEFRSLTLLLLNVII